ncbi:MAG: DNA mismatch repair endonuclease MutL [Gemmatimonadaceae bacterium]
MPSIATLPGAVADQIAAGEVVERPASVVKELVENALDAGATAIDITIDAGGRTGIRVSDDGTGMDRDDAVLALGRHATSKIRSAEDLVGVASFGFRGEALPAICSVSELVMETSPSDGAGTLIRAAGGEVVDIRDAARRRGTTVSVGRLFFNTPARQKFLRGARSEWRAISDVVTTIALVRRDVRIALTHDGRSVLALPVATSLRARLAALWGSAYAARMIDVDDVHGTTHVSGLTERPADVGTAGRRVHITVNGRAVRDHGMVRAAESAYRSTLVPGLRPSLFLDIVVSADAVDVNVHPAKAEVRFRDRWDVERAVESAVRRALGALASAAAVGGRAGMGTEVRVWPSPWMPGSNGVSGGAAAGSGAMVDVEMIRNPGVSAAEADLGGFLDSSLDSDREQPAGAQVPGAGHAPGAADARTIAVPPLVQLRRTWMMFEREEGAVLIDQHSAHERILYEQFMRSLESGELPAQRLLFPLTLHLGPAEGDALDANRDLFERLGFEIEGFGGHTLIVRSVPMPHPRFDGERCLRETLDALTGDRFPGTAARHERLAATVACKAAIKAGDHLSPDEMRALFVGLGRTTLPAHDVHGRSTIVLLGWDELERRFGRR